MSDQAVCRSSSEKNDGYTTSKIVALTTIAVAAEHITFTVPTAWCPVGQVVANANTVVRVVVPRSTVFILELRAAVGDNARCVSKKRHESEESVHPVKENPNQPDEFMMG